MKEEFHFYDKQVVIKSNRGICLDSEELIKSNLFKRMLEKYLKYLKKKDSPLLGIFKNIYNSAQEDILVSCFLLLSEDNSIEEVSKTNSQFELLLRDSNLFYQFIEKFYDFWRDYERFLIKYDLAEDKSVKSYKKPYRAFNQTIEQLNHLVRKTYRNICENVTGDHPRIYRQIPAGCQVGLITTGIDYQLPLVYKNVVRDIPLITQILIEPPLIIDPLMNKRAGQFEKVDINPLQEVKINPRDWLCFPAKVGDLIIY